MNTATDSAGRVMTVTVPVVRPAEPADAAQPLRAHTPAAAPFVFPRAAAQRGRGLHGQLVQQLGQMIVAGELGSDRPLVPEEIGHRFEVSRTVVRESLRVDSVQKWVGNYKRNLFTTEMQFMSVDMAAKKKGL